MYQVGGAVRDRLLGAEVKDRDWVVTGATPEQMIELGFKKVGADFPVFLHPDTGEEYALARTERKKGRGYRGFEVFASSDVTLEDDLARRDLTINAMAEDEDGNLIDPFDGRADLDNRVLRHVTVAFREDPLRVLRVARFAARFDYGVADDTLTLMGEIAASGELQTLTSERVWQELRRALGAPFPARFIAVLRECGALVEIFPEIDKLFGVPQPAKHHPEIDTGTHLLLALEQAARKGASDLVRFAVLTHDLGKGETDADTLPSHHGHEERGVDLIKDLCARLKTPKEFRELSLLVARYHTKVHRALELNPSTLLGLLKDTDAFRRRARFEQFLEACVIDATGRAGLQGRDYPQADRLRKALEVAAGVDTQALRAAGTAGAALHDALHQARVETLKQSGV